MRNGNWSAYFLILNLFMTLTSYIIFQYLSVLHFMNFDSSIISRIKTVLIATTK